MGCLIWRFCKNRKATNRPTWRLMKNHFLSIFEVDICDVVWHIIFHLIISFSEKLNWTVWRVLYQIYFSLWCDKACWQGNLILLYLLQRRSCPALLGLEFVKFGITIYRIIHITCLTPRHSFTSNSTNVTKHFSFRRVHRPKNFTSWLQNALCNTTDCQGWLESSFC